VKRSDAAVNRWALGLPPWIGTAATIALVTVLVALALFGSLVSLQTAAITANVERLASLSTAFQNARFAVEQQEAVSFEYRLSPGLQYRAEFASAGRDLLTQLAIADKTAGSVDRSDDQLIRTTEAAYAKATLRMFDAIDAGDLARADVIASDEIGPIFQGMESGIYAETLQHQEDATAALLGQRALSNGTLRIFPVVFGVGLLLVAFLTLVMQVNRRARDAKSRLLASVSHELRTPLNAILGFSQLILATQGATLNEKGRRYIENIHSSGVHLLALINDVLDMSKAEAGKMGVELSPIAVDEVITAALEEIAPLLGAKNLDLRPLAGARGLTASADRMRLRQVLLNGLSNAIKFTEEGGAIRIETSLTKGSVLIDIVDTGKGIPAGQLSRMFEEFEQLDNSRSRRGEGTGIGLPLSRTLMEMMGGRLTLSSREGVGTTFHVRLRPATIPIVADTADVPSVAPPTPLLEAVGVA
jgi:signal transduction histidine kinase